MLNPARPTRTVLDCDTGTDDAVAIMLAALHPAVELLGVGTVWGNHDVRHTTDNTLRVLALVGRADVGVHPGRNGPVRPRLEPLPSGRDDVPWDIGLPAAGATPSTDAVEWLVETLRGATDPVTLVPTGPLTNVAAAIAADPGVVDAVDRLVAMGGAHRVPGVTPYAERNVWCDPEAAADVLAAGFRDVLLVTADATTSAALTRADAERLRALGTPAGTTTADLLEQRIAWYERDAAMRNAGAAPLHDALAVAAVVDPGVVTARPARVAVERADRTTYGATRLDLDVPASADGVVQVALEAHHDRFLELLVATLGDSERRAAR